MKDDKAEKIKEAHRLLDRLDFLLAKMLRDINAAQLKKAA